MPRPGSNRRARSVFGLCDAGLLSRPLDFIQAEHARHRELCRAAEELAQSEPFDVPLARAVVEFVETDMALHLVDEEEDLFPALRRRIKPDDEADHIIGLLSGEHAADKALGDEIAVGLRQALASKANRVAEPLRNALLAFADRQRRHLTAEDGIVLPLAKRRLSKRDLERMGCRMAARRNITLGDKTA